MLVASMRMTSMEKGAFLPGGDLISEMFLSLFADTH